MSCNHEWGGAVIPGPVNRVVIDQCENCGELRLPDAAEDHKQVAQVPVAYLFDYNGNKFVGLAETMTKPYADSLADEGTTYRPLVFADAAPPAQAVDLGPVIEEAIACFNAAECEGWHEALAEGDIERIRDLWNRRIEFAYRALIDSRQTG